jgi:peroxidase
LPNEQEQKTALAAGKQALGDKEVLEESMDSPAYNTPSFRAQRAVGTTVEARQMAKIGYVENHATMFLAKNHKKPFNDRRWSVGKGPNTSSLGWTRPKGKCDFNAKYRTVNGTCNNKEHPEEFGVAMRPFRRVLNPDYADGISIPRKSHDGSELPSARQISLEVHRPSYHSDYNFTVMLAVWGQFLDHDITSTALNQGDNGQPIECCNTEVVHPECFPVPIEKGDPYFDDYNVTCLNFVRSIPAPTGYFGPREQLNQATAFIDGSVVYGNTDAVVDSLRAKQGGKLLMFTTPDNRQLLPHSRDPTDGCNEKEMNVEGKYCFATGDKRANENLLLTSMHLIFARHHNFLAQNLEQINPHWTDEQLFLEARRILGERFLVRLKCFEIIMVFYDICI